MAEPAGRTRRRVAVLISGRGSNLQALIGHCATPAASATIALVVSNQPAAAGLAHAHAAGIPVEVVDHRRHAGRERFEAEINSALENHGIEIICLAGFMRILSADMVERWRDRVLNIHPSLLPALRGLDTHRRALEAGVRLHGCTVHFSRAEVDAGPIIVQGAVPVHADDTADRLAARVLSLEHRCYPLALELVAAGRVRVADERVIIEGARAPDLMLMNPLPDPTPARG
jgi:phosphoribosylglycinamide formyltransferase-1